MKFAPLNWDGSAVSLVTAAHLVGRTSSRFSRPAQGWSIATTLGYNPKKLKARCPANAGRRKARSATAKRSGVGSAGTSASFSAPQFVFKIKNSPCNAGKIGKVMQGYASVLTPSPRGTPLPCAHSHPPFPQNPLFSIVLPIIPSPKMAQFYPQKQAIYGVFVKCIDNSKFET
jgi:hypothetical protein